MAATYPMRTTHQSESESMHQSACSLVAWPLRPPSLQRFASGKSPRPVVIIKENMIRLVWMMCIRGKGRADGGLYYIIGSDC